VHADPIDEVQHVAELVDRQVAAREVNDEVPRLTPVVLALEFAL
jgi:hypothetical protein